MNPRATVAPPPAIRVGGDLKLWPTEDGRFLLAFPIVDEHGNPAHVPEHVAGVVERWPTPPFIESMYVLRDELGVKAELWICTLEDQDAPSRAVEWLYSSPQPALVEINKRVARLERTLEIAAGRAQNMFDNPPTPYGAGTPTPPPESP